MNRIRIVVVLLILIVLWTVAAAAAVPSDSLGIVGDDVVKFLERWLGTESEAIYVRLIGLGGAVLYALSQLLLRKSTTIWTKSGVKIGWKVLSWLFGKSILFYNSKSDGTVDGERKRIEEFKKHLRRHDPLLKLDLEKMDSVE